MFSKQLDTTLADLSTDLCDEADWRVGILRTFTFPLNISALAVEPLGGLIAVGTADGAVYIFGGPSVESRISLPEPIGVRFLHFSISTYFLLCFDEKNQLHIYNLLEYGRPKIVTSARFDPTNALTVSPSHTHVFLAMQNGEIRTYDLTCLRKSPYTVPNLWRMYEKDQFAKGIPSLLSPAPQETIDVVVHPRNLNLLFVAYAGGVILMDLTERSTIRAYELVLQPGAPGGAGYGKEDILTHRRLTVACVALHPTGHFFAVGYTDGSIAFWAVEDDTKPLVTRTLDDDHVDAVDQDLLRAHMDAGKKFTDRSRFVREPIYKLSWSGFTNSSDPRGGETVLTVLGGLVAPKNTTVTILALPAFNPPAPPADNSLPQNQLHPEFRLAMYQSVRPKRSFTYENRGPVQDYLLLPKENPHFGGTFDPYVILFILDVENTRTIDAVEFPPKDFVCTSQALPIQSPLEASNDGNQKEPLSPGSSKSPSASSFDGSHQSQLHFVTPFPLSNASSLVRSGRLFVLRNDVYENFVLQDDPGDLLDLKGGLAFPDSGQMNELKLSKYQPRKILFTYNEDKTIRFFDLSSTLLIPAENEPIKYAWPKPLTSLTIRLLDLRHPTFADKDPTNHNQISIQSVQVAAEALEVAISLSSGEVLVYHSTTRNLADKASSPKPISDKEIVLIDDIPSGKNVRLKPFFMLCAGQSQVQTLALSDIGFLAVSYRDGSLTIVDMRGPRIIHTPATDKRQERRKSQGLSPSESGTNVITSLTWTICPLDRDPRLRVRLIAVSQSGIAEAYTLVYSSTATWSIMSEIISCKGAVDALPDSTFVIDTKSGVQLRTEPSRLAMTFRTEQTPSEKGMRCLLVSVGAKHLRVNANVNGEKVGKVELSSKFGLVVSSQIVAHNQSHALVLQTDKNTALAYSLPYLEHVASIQLPQLSPIPISIDESGDFIAWSLFNSKGKKVSGPQPLSVSHINGATYGTFFDLKRAYTLPDVDFAATRKPSPPQPQPVSLGPVSFLGGLGAWLPFNQTISGEKVDHLLGGPDRPIPEKVALEKSMSAAGDGGAYTTAAGLAAGAATVQANLYNRLTGVLGERGQLLGDLEDRINSLGEGSRNMATQAKRLAAQQSAKSWFGF